MLRMVFPLKNIEKLNVSIEKLNKVPNEKLEREKTKNKKTFFRFSGFPLAEENNSLFFFLFVVVVVVLFVVVP